MDNSAGLCLRKARACLLVQYPFFGFLALYLNLKEDEAVVTMSSDGQDLTYSPSFVESIVGRDGLACLMGILMHEILHGVLQHIWRRDVRNRVLWNAATDYAVNLLVKNQALPLPEGALLEERFDNLTAETIYNILSQENPFLFSSAGENNIDEGVNPNTDNSCKFRTIDNHSIWYKSKSEKEKEPSSAISKVGMANIWKARVAQTVQTTKKRSSMPVDVERLIEKMLYPKLDWRQALAAFVQPARGDYSFISPDRRYSHIYLPDFSGEGIEDIVVGVDTSGSVWGLHTQFLALLIDIVHSYPEFKGYIGMCDSHVRLFEEIDNNDLPTIFQGGGGTDFRPFFQEIEQRGINPSLVVFLTDGKAIFPELAPPYSVLWVLTGEGCPIPPFGAVSYMDVECS